MEKNIKIYRGLILNEAAVKKIIPTAIFSPPIRPGDLIKDIKKSVHVVGIFDGHIDHGEILQALRAGLKIYGAIGIGALRAVELEPFGMIGGGEIFNFIKNQSKGTNHTIHDMSYIDFKFSMNYLASRKIIRVSSAKSLTKAYDKIHYRKRPIEYLKSKFRRSSVILSEIESIRQQILVQKAWDAKLLLILMNGAEQIVEENNNRLNKK